MHTSCCPGPGALAYCLLDLTAGTGLQPQERPNGSRQTHYKEQSVDLIPTVASMSASWAAAGVLARFWRRSPPNWKVHWPLTHIFSIITTGSRTASCTKMSASYLVCQFLHPNPSEAIQGATSRAWSSLLKDSDSSVTDNSISSDTSTGDESDHCNQATINLNHWVGGRILKKQTMVFRQRKEVDFRTWQFPLDPSPLSSLLYHWGCRSSFTAAVFLFDRHCGHFKQNYYSLRCIRLIFVVRGCN